MDPIDPTRYRGNVVLTGFMGTGKSTVGAIVAETLGFDFVDTDSLIENRHGPIPDIFASEGEEHFRVLEQGIAEELSRTSALVIATGGRLMLDPANHAALAHTGRVFCLSASVDSILHRVLGDGAAARPLLDANDPARRIRTLLAQRAEAYSRFEQIDTEDKTPGEVAAEITAALIDPQP